MNNLLFAFDFSGPFAVCGEALAAEEETKNTRQQAYENCVEDVCLGDNGKGEEDVREDARCGILEGFADVCQEVSEDFKGWRSGDLCRKFYSFFSKELIHIKLISYGLEGKIELVNINFDCQWEPDLYHEGIPEEHCFNENRHWIINFK